MSPKVVIAGASSGIGQATARTFCAEGAMVINLDIQDGSQTAKLCGEHFHSIHTDLSEVDSIGASFAQADAILNGQPLDVFVSCAAISKAQPFFEVDPASIDQMFSVNVRGTFLACQEAARRMKQSKSGHLILITSVAAVSAWAKEPVYCITKGAQMAMVQALAIELAPFGILVNAVGPGPIQAPPGSMAHTRTDPEVLRHDLEHTPLNRFGKPEEIAEAVLFLSKATWMTGQTIYVDGGFLATGLAYFGSAKQALMGEEAQ